MNIAERTSALGRLLEELSWVGKKVRDYRKGGQGYENVLTVEVFQSLDFLPRSMFLGEILRSAHGAAAARQIVVNEIERADLTLLPGSNYYLIPSKSATHTQGLSVQPDGMMSSPNSLTLIEAKRIRSSSFQAEQLARELTLVAREAQVHGKTPLLFLILGSEPPIKVQGHGKLSITDSIAFYLESVLSRAENHEFTAEELINQIPETVAWITWSEISHIVQSQLSSLAIEDQSVAQCVNRLAQSVIRSIEWHK